MTCPPSPGVVAYLVCVLATLWANPLALAGLLLSLGAAVSAALLTMRRPDHRPICILGTVWLADVIGWLLAPALAADGPFTGWLRVLQHLDTARFLIWPMAVQTIVGLAFTETRARRQAGRVLLIALPGFYALMIAVAVACYPALRGEALGRFYACMHANAVIWSLFVAHSWILRSVRRLPLLGVLQTAEGEPPEPLVSPARIVASLLVALELLSVFAGPWWRGLFGAAYRAEQVILCTLFAAIVGVQVWAMRTRPTRATDRPEDDLTDLQRRVLAGFQAYQDRKVGHPGEGIDCSSEAWLAAASRLAKLGLIPPPVPNPFVHDRPLGDGSPRS